MPAVCGITSVDYRAKLTLSGFENLSHIELQLGGFTGAGRGLVVPGHRIGNSCRCRNNDPKQRRSIPY